MDRKKVLLLSLLLLLSFSCKDKGKPGTEAVSRPTVEGVTIAAVQPAALDEYFETSGTIKAKVISQVAGRMMGTVTALKVKEGDRVREGQVLATIDDRDVAQRVTAAEKALEAARQNKSLADSTYDRYKKLFEGKALSRQELDQIDTQKKVADLEYQRTKALFAEAQISRGFTAIRAPIPGVVTEKKIEHGSMAVPGVPLLVVEDTSSYQLETYLDEGILGKISMGMPVTVIIESLGKQMEGRIVEIIPTVDPMSRTFEVKIAVSGSFLKTGLYAKVRIPVGKKECIVLPGRAIVEKGQLTGVYAVDSTGIVTYRLIRAGKHYGSNVEILSGVTPNDKVIIDGVSRAVDGGIVRGIKQ